MIKNPFINAGAAAVYIGAVVFFFNLLSNPSTPDTALTPILAPLVLLSLLVLSVLVMAYCFFFTPVQMYLDGQKKEAVRLFSTSVAAFAGIVVIFLGILVFTL